MDSEQLFARIRTRTTRCDWSEFVELAEVHGFRLEAGKGSRRRLVHASGFVVSVHQPHPSKNPVHPEAVKALLRWIEQQGNHED